MQIRELKSSEKREGWDEGCRNVQESLLAHPRATKSQASRAPGRAGLQEDGLFAF